MEFLWECSSVQNRSSFNVSELNPCLSTRLLSQQSRGGTLTLLQFFFTGKKQMAIDHYWY